MAVLLHLLLLYLFVGTCFAAVSHDYRNRRGTFAIVSLIWIYLIFVEGTPRMRKFKDWVRRSS